MNEYKQDECEWSVFIIAYSLLTNVQRIVCFILHRMLMTTELVDGGLAP
jgi:hypothetical protein